MPKRRLATGIYRDAHGISVVYYVNGRRAPEGRFPPDTPVERIIKWRKTQIAHGAEMAPRDPRGSLAREIVRYLKRLKGRPGYKSEKSHLRAWLLALGNIPRWDVTREKVELTVAGWREAGYAARTIRHRVRAFQALFHRLDGPQFHTPLDRVTLPPKPKPRPISVADPDIAGVALELLKHEQVGYLRDSKTRARFLVLMTHVQRPVELRRTVRKDVDLDRRVWATRGAKGGYNTIIPLNDEQVAAWKLFIAADAFGDYDTRSFVRVLQRCGWPKGIRPYNLRHSTGFALSERDVDLGDIQELFMHTSPATTRSFYVPGQLKRLRTAAAKLDGRFGPAPFFTTSTSNTGGRAGRERTGNDREKAGPEIGTAQRGRRAKSRKQA